MPGSPYLSMRLIPGKASSDQSAEQELTRIDAEALARARSLVPDCYSFWANAIRHQHPPCIGVKD
ncbi:MAG: hypothetical protein H0X14_08785 [Acidobacteria bacterium]|nr:hypothetical protein [Acidobacteriota bacterium]